MYSLVLLRVTLCCPELIVNCLFPKASLGKFTQWSRILAAFHLMGTVINKTKKKGAGTVGSLLGGLQVRHFQIALGQIVLAGKSSVKTR